MQVIFLKLSLKLKRLALSNLSESKVYLYMYIFLSRAQYWGRSSSWNRMSLLRLLYLLSPPHHDNHLPRKSCKLASFSHLRCGCILGVGQLLCLTYIRGSCCPYLNKVISKRSVSWLLASSQLLTLWLCHSQKWTLPGPVRGDSHCLASTSWWDKVRQSVLLQGSSRVQIVFLLWISSGYKHDWPLT